MKNTVIIIPSRLSAKRFPNKPLKKINDLPMIIHVLNRAKESKVGEVIVATPDYEIFDTVKKNGGKAILTKNSHQSGSDRVYEAYLEELNKKIELIINLQGDMPNIKPSSISQLAEHMTNSKCDVGTLASNIKDNADIKNKNIVKVETEGNLKINNFLDAKDFFRTTKDLNNKNIYHHIGIYAYSKNALTKYVKLPQSRLEIERKLEQMRILENKLVIKVALSNSTPLGVDTEEDFMKVTKEMTQL